jgi:hypothetical protein
MRRRHQVVHEGRIAVDARNSSAMTASSAARPEWPSAQGDRQADDWLVEALPDVVNILHAVIWPPAEARAVGWS